MVTQVRPNHASKGGKRNFSLYPFSNQHLTKRFGFFRWEMPSKQAPEGWCAAEGVTLGAGPQGRTSSIGAVMDTMKAQRFTLSDDGPHDDVPDVSALLKRMSSQAFAAS